MSHGRRRVVGILACCPSYGIGVLLAATLWRQPLLLASLYCALIVAMLVRWHTKPDVTALLLGALLGPMAEIPAIHSGAWSYSSGEMLIPLWLPLAWGVAGLCLKKITEVLVITETPKGAIEVVHSPNTVVRADG